jgi:hypothetical protein
MRLCVVLALSVSASIAAAQRSPVRLGLFAGVNEAKVDGSAVSDISNHTGGVFGGYVSFPLSPEWRFQAGAGYTMKGWERDEPGTHDFAVVKLNYIELPLLLGYDFNREERVGASLFGGAGLAFRTGCSVGVRPFVTGVMTTLGCADVQNLAGFKFQSFDAGAIAGGAVHLAVGRERLVASAQYELGLTKIYPDRDARNRAFTFSLGVEVPIR